MATICRNVRLFRFITSNFHAPRDGNLMALECSSSIRARDNSTSTTDPEKGSPADKMKSQQPRDPFPLFCSEKVQSILIQITGFDIDKINRPRLTYTAPPHYDLLTDRQLKKKEARSEAKAKTKLQMPPFLKARESIASVLCKDEEIAGIFKSKFIFTDITYGLSDRKRHIVVREDDGTLRNATWEERDKVNQIYNPQKGRKIFVPKLFSPEDLERVLSEGRYVYILDKACVQFEPDNPEFIRVTHRTYEVVNSKQDYEDLWSTRHFGSMAFYLAWYKKIDGLLLNMLKRDKLHDAADLVTLYYILHQDSSSAVQSEDVTDPLQLVEIFAQTDAKEKGQLQLAVQYYQSAKHTKAL